MDTIKLMHGLSEVDAKSVRRDAMLRSMLVLPLIIALAARWVLPLVLHRIGTSIGADVSVYYQLIMGAALLLITPIMYGLVVGLLLLDQRDEQTLLALQVTPMPINQYLLYRLMAPMIISFVVTPLAMGLAGLPHIPLTRVLFAVLAAAMLAPLCTLTLAAFAQNKVQGFALMKGLSVFMVAPLAGVFVPFPWQWGFGVLPTYWPTRVYWSIMTYEPGVWLYIVGGTLVNVTLLAWLLRRFDAVVHR